MAARSIPGRPLAHNLGYVVSITRYFRVERLFILGYLACQVAAFMAKYGLYQMVLGCLKGQMGSAVRILKEFIL